MYVQGAVYEIHFSIIISKIPSLGTFDSFNATELIITFC